MNHGLGKGPRVRVFAAEEEGNAAIEMALLASLAAFVAFGMKHMLAAPLLNMLTKSSQVISQALAG